MLFIKGNRIHANNFSFELPQGLSIITDPDGVKVDTLNFETLDGKFIIEIGAGGYSRTALEYIELMKNNNEIIFQSEILPIVRGNMRGFGFYYTGVEWRHEYYAEFLEYPMNEEGQTLFDLLIAHELEEDNSGDALKDFMNEKNIKAFLDSIE